MIPGTGGGGSAQASIIVQNSDGTSPVQYLTLSAAAANITNGQVCVVTGTWTMAATFNAANITIRGGNGASPNPGSPTLPDQLTGAITADGKGCLVLNGASNTVKNLGIIGAVSSLNINGDTATAAIRYAGNTLTITQCAFVGNTNGVLGDNFGNGNLTMTGCYLSANGDGGGATHNVYVGMGTNLFTFQNGWSLSCVGGYQIKTRAVQTTITGSYLASLGENPSAEPIDASYGGVVNVSHCVLEAGPGTGVPSNFVRIAFNENPTGNFSTANANIASLGGIDGAGEDVLYFNARIGAVITDSKGGAASGATVVSASGTTAVMSANGASTQTASYIFLGTQSTTFDTCIFINDTTSDGTTPEAAGLFNTNSLQTCNVSNSTLVANGNLGTPNQGPINLKTGGSGTVTGTTNTTKTGRSDAGYAAYNGLFNCLPALP